MISRWTAHLSTDEEKKKFEEMVRTADAVLRRLYDIMQEDYALLCERECSEKDFETPSWSFKQAFRNGSISWFRKLTTLLSHLDQRK